LVALVVAALLAALVVILSNAIMPVVLTLVHCRSSVRIEADAAVVPEQPLTYTAPRRPLLAPWLARSEASADGRQELGIVELPQECRSCRCLTRPGPHVHEHVTTSR
jgi:hypothetical protein